MPFSPVQHVFLAELCIHSQSQEAVKLVHRLRFLHAAVSNKQDILGKSALLLFAEFLRMHLNGFYLQQGVGHFQHMLKLCNYNC